ncbi:alpha/beta hydrolase [Embleya scabrispora]|uniref:alpha/beta hydrolase n=1 Tax=Embleya scabrispora TaxID=159449 RepID=UPI000363706A|nr:alpha/beta hydrolase [Embleya scabrispora]MYS80405.1 alpha/beta hydrolase fold domain-containing protein [Streptomyces sp. SID5474]
MPVAPQIQPILDAVAAAPPLLADLPLAERRAASNKALESSILAFAEPAPEGVTTRDVNITVKEPEPGRITARVYTPAGPAPRGGRPGYVYLHDGAWWLGAVDRFDGHCAHIAAESGAVVISVEYRLAPEFKFPWPLEDAYAAWIWVQERAFQLGVNADKVAIGGAGAGGNLAAACSIMLRDRRQPTPLAQVLDGPILDLTLSQASVAENGEGYLLTREALEEAVRLYLTSPRSERTDPLASPLHAEDLAGLPAALVLTGEYDPLRDEGEAYAKQLEAAGVPVEAKRWDGFVHGAGELTALLPQAREYRSTMAQFLKRTLG